MGLQQVKCGPSVFALKKLKGGVYDEPKSRNK